MTGFSKTCGIGNKGQVIQKQSTGVSCRCAVQALASTVLTFRIPAGISSHRY